MGLEERLAMSFALGSVGPFPKHSLGRYEPPPATLRSGEERDGKNKVSVLRELTLELGSRHKLCVTSTATAVSREMQEEERQVPPCRNQGRLLTGVMPEALEVLGKTHLWDLPAKGVF